MLRTVQKSVLMNEDDIKRALLRISHQIVEKNHGTKNLCIVGILTRGVPLAKRISKNILLFENEMLSVGALDITLYRDDLTQKSIEPIVNSTSIPFDITGKHVVLVDDVIYTCRTARAAIEALMKIGRPSKISLAVLVDRGHSELPIKPTYVGKNVPTSTNEVIKVKLKETDGETVVTLCEITNE